MLPVRGVELYAPLNGQWCRHGHHLPAFDFPAQLEYRPLHQVLTPAPVEPLDAALPEHQPVLLTLVEDSRSRRTTALICDHSQLALWADTVTSGRLASLRAATCRGRVLLLGERLPLIPNSERYWGERVLVPLGRRLEPELPESALCAAMELSEHDLLVLRESGAERILGAHLRPLTRAAIKLACQEGKQ
jgi:hypothetical protein